jgi:hypothetical protein
MGAAHPNLARPVASHGFRIAGHFHMQRLAHLWTLELEQNGTAVFGWRGWHVLCACWLRIEVPPITIMIAAEDVANNMR